MSTPTIPDRSADVTPEWFTTVLRAAGVLGSDGRVESLRVKPVGNGLVGESLRFELEYGGSVAASTPRGVVCKFPASIPEYRAAGVSELLYQREVRYYQDIAATVKVRSPRAFFAASDEATQNFVLVLEDLGPASAGNQIDGCSVEQAGLVMDAAAKLHGPRWGDPQLDTADWNLRSSWIPRIQSAYPDLFTSFCEVFKAGIEPAHLEIGKRFAPRIGEWFAQQPRPWTITHGDFRLDNMLFDILGGREPLAVLDWQTLLPGPGASDVSYFLGGCLSTENRRAHERTLLQRYHAALVSQGVHDYPFERLWTDYRYNTFMGYFICSYASTMVPRTERGDSMFAIWLQRAANQIIDLDCMSLLPE